MVETLGFQFGWWFLVEWRAGTYLALDRQKEFDEGRGTLGI